MGQFHVWSHAICCPLIWCSWGVRILYFLKKMRQSFQVCFDKRVLQVRFEYDAGVCDIGWDTYGSPETMGAFYYGVWCFFYQLMRPSLIILYCNVGIIRISKGTGQAAKDAKKEQSEESKANAKILKAMLICIVAFFMCSFPLGVVRITKIFHETAPIPIPGLMSLSTTMFQFLSSCVNPLIYGLFRKDFKDAYAKILKNIKNKLKS